MAQPQPYTPTASFEGDEANAVSGRSTVRTGALDTELANIQTSLNQAITNLGLIQRDDGALRDLIVDIGSLSSAVLLLMGSAGFTISNPLGWLTATTYAARAVVTHSTGTYVCAVAHTSGTFATDLAAGKWALLFDSATFSAANVSFTPTGTLVSTNVQAAIAELLAKSVVPVDTAAALQALPVPTAATKYLMCGYNSVGDGAGGFFWWNAADTTAANGGTVFACTANGASAGRFNKLF